MTNYYDILGVSFNVGEQELRACYKRLAVQNHPDKHGGDPYYEEKFKNITEAYRVLSDPVARKRYDLKLFYGGKTSMEHASASPMAARRRHSRPAPSVSAPPRKTGFKAYVYLSVLIGAIVSGGIWLYYGMNSFASKTYYREAESLYYTENYQKAFLKYMQVLEVDPENAGAYERLGDLRIELMEDRTGAVQFYTRAIHYSDSLVNIGLYLKTGKALQRLDRPDEALGLLKQALAVRPDADSLWTLMGELYYGTGDYAASLQAFDKAVAIDRSDLEALYGKALVEYVLADYRSSLSTCDQLIGKEKDNPAFYMLRARNYLELQDTLMACTDLHKASLFDFPFAEALVREVCASSESR